MSERTRPDQEKIKCKQVSLIRCTQRFKKLTSILIQQVMEETYTAITGSTSHGSGTSRFIVRVLDNGILAKNALGPLIV